MAAPKVQDEDGNRSVGTHARPPRIGHGVDGWALRHTFWKVDIGEHSILGLDCLAKLGAILDVTPKTIGRRKLQLDKELWVNGSQRNE